MQIIEIKYPEYLCYALRYILHRLNPIWITTYTTILMLR